MSAEKEIRRTNAWLRRRINPKRMLKPDKPIIDYRIDIPLHWLENIAAFAKVMSVVLAVCLFAGYASVFIWVTDNVGHYR